MTTTGAGTAASRTRRRRSLFAPNRVDGVDFARGIALIGMLAAHLLVIPDVVWSEPETYGGLVHGRSSILFATLAGVSIGLVSGGPRPLSGDRLGTARLRLLVRAGAIWTVGVVLLFLAVPVYVILPAYAILFVLATGVLSLRARTLFIAAAVVGLLAPFAQAFIDGLPFWSTVEGVDIAAAIGWQYPFVTWFAFVLAGMGAARLDLRRLRTSWVLVGVGGALTITGAVLAEVWGETETFEQTVWTADPHSSGLFEVIGFGGSALLIIGICVLLCRTPFTWIALPLRAVGSMPLTAYAGHIVVWAVTRPPEEPGVFELDTYRALEPFWPMTLGIVLFCTLWAVLVGRGPLEWAIDALARLVVRDPGATPVWGGDDPGRGSTPGRLAE